MTEFEQIYRAYFTDVELYLRSLCRDEARRRSFTRKAIAFRVLRQ